MSDFGIVFSKEACKAPGQVFFDNVSDDDDYSITVSKTGYDTYTNKDIDISTGSWNSITVDLMPQ